MPGGQFTNLKEQASAMGLASRWPEIARTYAEVNQLFGDIVKVTPSSKVVGDMTMFLITRGIKPADVLNLEPGSTPFPESVIDMLAGGLGQPLGGWPKKLQAVVLGERKGRPGAGLKSLNLKKIQQELSTKLKRDATLDDVFSHIMYPEVFAEFAKKVAANGDLSVLPTPAFFYGMKAGPEISVEIEPGKTLFIRLVNIGAVDAEGKRALNFELNGMTRQLAIVDKSVKPTVKARVKADSAKTNEVGAPIPGLVTVVSVSVGAKVAKGDKLLTLEAMKMQTTIYAPCDGVVEEICVSNGEAVESKDLILKLRAA
jgi:pyruvate carboxylase